LKISNLQLVIVEIFTKHLFPIPTSNPPLYSARKEYSADTVRGARASVGYFIILYVS